MIAIIQPDECGVDASPKFDPLMRYPKDNRELVAWIDWLYRHYAPLRFNDAAILDLDLFQVLSLLVDAVARALDDVGTALPRVEDRSQLLLVTQRVRFVRFDH